MGRMIMIDNEGYFTCVVYAIHDLGSDRGRVALSVMR